jgi:hypothetical protein
MPWIEVVAVATIISAMSIAAQSGVRSPNASPAPHAKFDRSDEERSCMGERDSYLDRSLLKHAKLGFYKQLGPADSFGGLLARSIKPETPVLTT